MIITDELDYPCFSGKNMSSQLQTRSYIQIRTKFYMDKLAIMRAKLRAKIKPILVVRDGE